MSDNILYGIKRSPYVRSVMMAFEEKGVDYALTPPGDSIEALKSPDYLKIHPFGRVPAFKNSKVTLFETAAICRYIDEAFDGPALLPDTPEARAVADQWSCALSCYILAQAINGYAIHLFKARRENRALDPDIAKPALEAVAGHMDILENRLGDVPYLAGEGVAIPDLMLAPAIQSLSQLPGTDEIISARPNINAWYGRISERPSFIKVHA